MNTGKVKALTEGAIAAALTVLLMVLTVYVPLFAMLSVLIVGLPTMFTTVRHGGRIAVLSAGAAVLVMIFLLGDLLSTVLLAVTNLLPGLMIGFAIRHRKSFKTMVFAASGAVLIGLMLELLLLNASGGGDGIVRLLDGALENTRQILNQAAGQFGETEQAQLLPILETMNQALGRVKELLLLYLPTLVIAMASVMGYGAAAVGIFMLRRLRIARVPYVPFSMLHATRAMCYLSVILSLVGNLAQDTTVFTAALQNMSLILDCFIGVCGLSLIDYKLGEKISSGYARAGIYLVVLVIGYVAIGLLAQVLVFLGFLDGLFRFRRFHKVGENHGENK
ncbi:MAG: DUF2232 domain-containing protein [Clostridia bacterium]|nr:DUF2232 domain-containing protein [Clostridia bacterium]